MGGIADRDQVAISNAIIQAMDSYRCSIAALQWPIEQAAAQSVRLHESFQLADSSGCRESIEINIPDLIIASYELNKAMDSMLASVNRISAIMKE